MSTERHKQKLRFELVDEIINVGIIIIINVGHPLYYYLSARFRHLDAGMLEKENGKNTFMVFVKYVSL